jgi:lysophospholipase L1-like esterase
MGRQRLRVLAASAGGAAAAAGLAAGVLFGQVLFARKTIPGAQAPPPQCGGRYGREYEAPGRMSLRLAVLGDSTAAGYGVHIRAQTPGAMLATSIAEAVQRPVLLCCPAAVGSPSAWLPAQAETVIEEMTSLDLAVIFVGANDVTAGESATQAVGHLAQAVRMLRGIGAQVVVATCPDLGTIRPILPPLRWLVRRWSRTLARAQRAAVEHEGAHTVSLGDLLGPIFDAEPATMFGVDRYHPSTAGYRAAVDVVLPTVHAVLAALPERAERTVAEQRSGEQQEPAGRGEDAVSPPGAGLAAGRSA